MFGWNDLQHLSVAALLIGGLLAGSAIAAEEVATKSGDGPKQSQISVQADEAKVCKRVVPTGSRIARRYCLTRGEWDAMRDAGQKAARDAFALESQYGYDASPSGS